MQAEPMLTTNAVKVLGARYLMKDEAGQVIETPKGLFERVARHVSTAEELYGADSVAGSETQRVFYELMASTDFEPNTPCLANAGRPGGNGQLSACFVLPIDDDMTSIFTTLMHTALIHKSGGGTGFSFSRLRHKDDFVRSTTGVASGPISFMKSYNAVTECVKQSGIRRGANMGILRVDHPDILDFIDCKKTACLVCRQLLKRDICDHEVTNFNISVAITNKFMAALLANEEYELISPRTKKVVRRLSARMVWEKIINNAWTSGEPGLFFIDRVNERDPLSAAIGEIEATNPCGEVPLRPYDACTLGSINLGNFVRTVSHITDQRVVNWEALGQTVHKAVRFLDDVLTVNKYPVPQIHEVTSNCRKIGLGVMGWADMLIKLGLRYDSREALELGREVMRFINTNAVAASEALAVERGPFPLWEQSTWKAKGCKPRRNSTVTVIAPTGSISIIAGCSSGIEPLFAVVMVRNQAGMEMVDVNPEFERIAKTEGWYTDELMKEVAAKGSVQTIDGVPQRWKDVFKTTMDIDTEWHVKMQAVFQENTEDAVSKTINMPNSATVADVEKAYMMAWQLDCKGITVYRDGSRSAQVLNVGSVNKPGEAAQVVPAPKPLVMRKIPDHGRRVGETWSRRTGMGTVHMTINQHPTDSEPFECFVEIGKTGSDVDAMANALGRSMSYALQLPSPIPPRDRLDALADQFAGIGGRTTEGMGANKIVSVPDGISRILLAYLYEQDAATQVPEKRTGLDLCPQCGAGALAKGGKCDVCQACGFSKC